jgi:hypothetical protein
MNFSNTSHKWICSAETCKKTHSVSYSADRSELRPLKISSWFAEGTYDERDRVPSAIQNSWLKKKEMYVYILTFRNRASYI